MSETIRSEDNFILVNRRIWRNSKVRRRASSAVIDAANTVVRHHIFRNKEFLRLEPRLERSKAVVAIARRMQVVVWHVLHLHRPTGMPMPEMWHARPLHIPTRWS